MDIVKQMDDLTEVLTELIKKDNNHSHVERFIKECGDEAVQKEWNSLTKEEQRAVSDELYHYLTSSTK